MNRDELIDAVTEATSGTASDPLTRDDVAKVVGATIAALADDGRLTGADVEDLAEDREADGAAG